MRISILVDSEEFWAQLSQDIQNAQNSIYIQTFSFEGDGTGKMLAEALIASPAQDKRIIVDDYATWMVSDRFIYSPRNLFNTALRQEVEDTRKMIRTLDANGIRVQFTRPAGLFEKFAIHNHKKVILIDRHIAYIGGINFCEHNFTWHDSMVRLEDVEITEALCGDFYLSWAGIKSYTRKSVNEFELFCLNGSTNYECFDKILDLIDGARQQIYVESPYITFPFLDHLKAAAQRGCAVTLITPGPNNHQALREYILSVTANSGLEVRLYNRMSHLKAMMIDQRHLILGSSNFDYLSYQFHQEIVAILTNPKLVSEFMNRVFLKDFRHSQSGRQAATLKGGFIHTGMKAAARFFTYLAHHRLSPEALTISIPSPTSERRPVLPRSHQ